MIKHAMSKEDWLEKEKLAFFAYLEANLPVMPARLSVDAWQGSGMKP